MKETLKRVEDLLHEIYSDPNYEGYEIIIESIDLLGEMVDYTLRKGEVVAADKDSFTKHCEVKHCHYENLTNTVVLMKKEEGDCIFDTNGYQIGGVFIF